MSRSFLTSVPLAGSSGASAGSGAFHTLVGAKSGMSPATALAGPAGEETWAGVATGRRRPARAQAVIFSLLRQHVERVTRRRSPVTSFRRSTTRLPPATVVSRLRSNSSVIRTLTAPPATHARNGSVPVPGAYDESPAGLHQSDTVAREAHERSRTVASAA